MGASKRVVDAFILAATERPDDFVIGEYTLHDKKSSYHFWIGIGFVYRLQRPFILRLNPWQSVRFGMELSKLKARKVEAALKYDI